MLVMCLPQKNCANLRDSKTGKKILNPDIVQPKILHSNFLDSQQQQLNVMDHQVCQYRTKEMNITGKKRRIQFTHISHFEICSSMAVYEVSKSIATMDSWLLKAFGNPKDRMAPDRTRGQQGPNHLIISHSQNRSTQSTPWSFVLVKEIAFNKNLTF